jgi:hypothetical protein
MNRKSTLIFYSQQQQQKLANPSPYSIGFAVGKHDAKINIYDAASACEYLGPTYADNGTAAKVYACLKGYSDAHKTEYDTGYLQGVQGVELKGNHTQEFLAGYINGTQLFQRNKGYAEGYNHLPMSSGNVKRYI